MPVQKRDIMKDANKEASPASHPTKVNPPIAMVVSQREQLPDSSAATLSHPNPPVPDVIATAQDAPIPNPQSPSAQSTTQDAKSPSLMSSPHSQLSALSFPTSRILRLVEREISILMECQKWDMLSSKALGEIIMAVEGVQEGATAHDIRCVLELETTNNRLHQDLSQLIRRVINAMQGEVSENEQKRLMAMRDVLTRLLGESKGVLCDIDSIKRSLLPSLARPVRSPPVSVVPAVTVNPAVPVAVTSVSIVSNVGSVNGVDGVSNVSNVGNAGSVSGVGIVSNARNVRNVDNVGSVSNVGIVSNVNNVGSVSNTGNASIVGNVSNASNASIVTNTTNTTNTTNVTNSATIPTVTNMGYMGYMGNRTNRTNADMIATTYSYLPSFKSQMPQNTNYYHPASSSLAYPFMPLQQRYSTPKEDPVDEIAGAGSGTL